MLGPRHFFYIAAPRNAPHFLSLRHRITVPFFQLKFSHHRINATAAPLHLILAPPRHILEEKIRAMQNICHWAVFLKKLLPITFLLNVPVSSLPSPGSCLLSHVSCLMCPVSWLLSHISCLLSHISCFTSPVSCLLSHTSCLTSPVSYLLPHVSCLMSPFSCISCLTYLVSCLLYPVSFILSHVSCLTYPVTVSRIL